MNQQLDYTNFVDTVLNDDNHAWIIAFMNPICGSCEKFAPVWESIQAYESMRNMSVRFGFVDISIQADKDLILENYGNSV